MPQKAALGVAVVYSELRTESRTIPRARVSSISILQQTTARRSQPPARAVVTAGRPNSPASLIGAWSRCLERRLRFLFWNLPSSPAPPSCLSPRVSPLTFAPSFSIWAKPGAFGTCNAIFSRSGHEQGQHACGSCG